MQRVRTVTGSLGGVGVMLAVAAWGVAGAASTPAVGEPALSGEATATVSALVAALNAHDIDGAMALFADPATVQDDRQPQTPEQIRGWLGQLAREDLRLDLRGQPTITAGVARQPSESVVWPATLGRTRDRQVGGVEHLDATVRAIVVDRHLSFLSIRPDSALVPVLAVG